MWIDEAFYSHFPIYIAYFYFLPSLLEFIHLLCGKYTNNFQISTDFACTAVRQK